MSRIQHFKKLGGRHTSLLAIILIQFTTLSYSMMNINTLLHLKNSLTPPGKLEKFGEKITTTYAP